MASVTITEYGKVNNISHVLQAGGSLLPNTQYWVKIYATDSNSLVMGPISDEFTFTTTATDLSVDLSWDVATGSPYGYAVLITDLTTIAKWYNKKIRGGGSNLYWSSLTNSLSVVGGETTYYNLHPFDMTQDFVGGMDKNLGAVLITVDCDSSRVGPFEIDALIADPLISYADNSNWFMRGSVKFSTTSAADFLATGYNIVLLGFFYWDSSVVGSVIQFGNSSGYTHPCTISHVTHGFHRPQTAGGCTYHYGTRYLGAGTYTGNTSSVIGPYSTMFRGGGAVLSNINWYQSFDIRTTALAMADSRVYGTITLTLNVELPDFLNNRANFWDTYAYSPSLYNCFSAAGSTSVSFRKAYGAAGPVKLYDFGVDNKDDNIPWIYWYGASTTNPEETRKYDGFEMWHGFGAVVTDQDGIEVVGASVTAKDLSGVTVYSETTNANGESQEQYLKRVDIYRNTNTAKIHIYDITGDYTDYDYHTPHTVTIIADGYQDYVWVGEINEKTEMQVALTETIKPIIVNNDYNVTVCYP